MKHLFFFLMLTWTLVMLSPGIPGALTPLTRDELQYERKNGPPPEPRQDVKPVVPVVTENPALVPQETERRPARRLTPLFSDPEPEKPAFPITWITDVGKLYIKDKLSDLELTTLFTTLEKSLGIQPDGRLDLIRARDAMSALHTYSEDPDKEFSNIYFDDKQNLTGYNFVYFEMCTVHKATEGERFKRYFEKGFYPNRNLFTKEEYYYKALYYYLLVSHDGLLGIRLRQRQFAASADLVALGDERCAQIFQGYHLRFLLVGEDAVGMANGVVCGAVVGCAMHFGHLIGSLSDGER